MRCRVGISVIVVLSTTLARAQNFYFSSSKKAPADFAITGAGKSTALLVSTKDFPGVLRAAKNLKADIGKVTDVEPEILFDQEPSMNEIIIVGTIGMNPLIDQMIKSKKLDAANLEGKWESFIIEIVEKPFPKVARALVVAGSDKRGTTFGIYEIAKQIGVSPWYWWADVPVKKNKNVFVSSGKFVSGEPAVKYRGIFLNDEEPSLGRWAVEKYGGFTHEFYEKVFELLLRLKGNFLWPAMWWAAFNADDPLNASLADEYGIVMSTSHHEPMMRAHAEWRKLKAGDWSYETNAPTLQKFWREGVERMGSKESIVTLAMRGDGDMAMSAETKTALLEKIVKDQRDIIADVTRKDIAKTPQVWAIYKEVQDYYDKGMRVPDDVTLLFCDDNWGNIRKLPNPNDKPRAGGYGIYYHFDYVGDPRNYKWLNTNPITKTWEQMHMAYEYGVDRIWIVNVGDLKPMEFPISFFLDYAWNPKKWNQNNLQEYTQQWCEEQFGKTYAKETADIISKYSKFNARRKPELLSPETYSLVNYHEAERIVAEYRALTKKAHDIFQKIDPSLKDAFYQLVMHPVSACANLTDMYFILGKNKLYASQGRPSTNELGERAKELYQNDSSISAYFNKTLAAGKWNHMMNQIHIGYTYWQDPLARIMPEIKKIDLPLAGEMGVAIEGATEWWPASSEKAILPEFNSIDQQHYYMEIFNRGKTPFDFTAVANVPWIKLSKTNGKIENELRIDVSVDWSLAPKESAQTNIAILGNGKLVNVIVNANRRSVPKDFFGFVETNKYISIEAEHFDKAVGSKEVSWQTLPDYGRTLSGVEPFPVTATAQTISATSPHLEYNLFLSDTASVNTLWYLGTTLNCNGSKSLRIAISIDDETPRVVYIHENETQKTWGKTVEDNMRLISEKWKVSSSGNHVLKYWMIDPGVVLQKIVVDAGGLKPSYLGPPESFRVK
ncbi:MAG TPA: glycosyl hydrolase 115 family protein [Cyclobacteriaceae bacterium]|nr:glycosyl hydrolase 115 family protein [Cyclobacteriaceae bacterium]